MTSTATDRSVPTRTTLRLAAFAVFAALLLVACKPSGAPAEGAAPPVAKLTAPPGNDDAAWKLYLQQEVGSHMAGVTDRVYPYYLPWDSDAATEGGTTMYGRQLEQVQGVVLRTVLPGNMLAFGSPNSTRMADLIVAAFTGAEPDALKGSQVLFIGKPADKERVEAAVRAAGAGFVFVEAK